MDKDIKYARWLEPFGFKLIPLNANQADRYYRKRPRDKDWIHKDYSQEQIASAYRANWAIGARVPAGYVVIDVDVKPGQEGLASLAKMPQEGLLDGSWVTTGSGGMHIFFKLPPGVMKVNTKFKALPGIDFRVVGSQVVCAGSINKDGGSYTWDETTEATEMVDIPEIPSAVWKYLTEQPEYSAHDSNSSQAESLPIKPNGHIYRSEELRIMFDSIDVTQYRDHDQWLKLMMATHSASGGSAEGMDEFYRWCQSEPQVELRVSREDLEYRWKSFHRDEGAGVVTVASLQRASSPVASAAIDFSAGVMKDLSDAPPRIDVIGPAGFLTRAVKNDIITELGGDPFDFSDSGSSDELVLGKDGEIFEVPPDVFSRLNEQFAVVIMGSKVRIAYAVANAFRQQSYSFLALADFALFTRTLPKVEVQKGNLSVMVNAAELWLDWPGRRQYPAVDFLPDSPQPTLDKLSDDDGKVLNLWTRWAPEAFVDIESLDVDTSGAEPSSVAGLNAMPSQMGGIDCAEIEELIFHLCGQNGDAYRRYTVEGAVPLEVRYLIDWLSWSFAYPDQPIGVAVAFRGAKGIGKGVFFQLLQWLTGDYTWITADMNQVVGQFNSQLRGTVFLCLDEALWSGDKRGAKRLQNIITEPIISTEEKGLPPVKTHNCLHVLLASNEEWIVPASGDDERRYCVFDSSAGLKKRFDFWQKIEDKYSLKLSLVHAALKNGPEADGMKVVRKKSKLLLELLEWFRARGAWLRKQKWVANNMIPHTIALKEQVDLDKSPLEIWWDEVCDLGELGGHSLIKGQGYVVWAQKIRDDFWSSSAGQKAIQDRYFARQGLDKALGVFLRKKLPGLQKVKSVVPEDLRSTLACSEAKYQAYKYVFTW